MSDIPHPAIQEKNVVYVASAKPPKETARSERGVIQSIDAALDSLTAYQTIPNATVNEIAKHIEHNPKADHALTLLKKEMDALEVIEVADALATINSPWGELAKALAGTQANEQYVEKLLFPLGAKIFREIRLMTNDPLTRQLMFQSIADDILRHPDRIHAAQLSLPKPNDGGTVKNTMRVASTQLLDGKTIHTTVLRSRLSAEQPLFDITAMEHSLEEMKQEHGKTTMPFAKEESAQSLREIQKELTEMKRIRQIIDRELPSVHDETSLMRTLDAVQHARFQGVREEIAPYKLEPWVPENVRTGARSELERIGTPKEDLYAKILKKVAATEHQFRSGQKTWAEVKYKDHMKWLADPKAQALGNQRIVNIIDLMMTITTLVSGVTGHTQRMIEGNYANGMPLNDYIDYIDSQTPWDVAADLATPKPPKNRVAI